MVRVIIDFSVFTTTGAYGVVQGPFDLPELPQSGGSVVLRLSTPVSATVGNPPQQFEGILRVENRLEPLQGTEEVLLALEDVTASTPEDAQQLINLCEKEHGLFGDVFDTPN